MSSASPPLSAPIAFGTDGVRGPAGTWPLTHEGARIIGLAVAEHARQGGARPRVLLGRDTRESGPALVQAVVEGLVAGGAQAFDGGVMPTAAVSCAVAEQAYDAGIVITASHNPWQDNGLKVLGPSGGKLPDQDALTARFGRASERPGGASFEAVDPMGPWLAAMPRLDLSGLTILVDAANGAGAPHAPGVLEALGARVIRRACAPDGRNINDGVGAMHPPGPDELEGAHLGLALDGDADRIVLIDPVSGVLDGDDILWLMSRQVAGPIVSTIMSNGGLERALGGRLERSQVGDRHVAELMVASGAKVGAEPSGHVLFVDGMPTGDGLYAALRVLAAVADAQGRPQLPLPVGGWTRWPATLLNHRYAGARPSIDGLASIPAAEAAGMRVVVRYSGTEPKVRVLVEGLGEGEQSAEAWCRRIVTELSS